MGLKGKENNVSLIFSAGVNAWAREKMLMENLILFVKIISIPVSAFP
jgi:hypothetical protein